MGLRLSKQKRSLLKGVFFITIFSNLALWLLRYYGGLEKLELLAFDSFVQNRTLEERKPRIVLVTVSESDIQKLEKWPLSDAKLATLLQNINQQKPRAIGLDIYRDLPIAPGSADLERVYRSIPNLIVIQKVAGTRVSPPKVMVELGQTAANDLVLDQDGRVRRFLLSLVDRNEEIVLSLSLRLALIFLEKEGITPALKGEDIILGKAQISPITPNSGSYIKQDTGGFQILANYGRFHPDYPRIPITDALEGKIPPGIMTDRIVLIGATAASLGDRFQTPLVYEGDDLPGTPGVEIHAAAIEQLLSSALEGRPLLHTWHDREETIWLFFWGVGGGFLAWYNDRSIKTIGFAVLAVLLLIGSCYTLFIFGYWIPLIPPLFSFVLVFSLDVMYILWQELSSSQKELAQYALVLEEKVKLRTKELELKNIDLQNAQDELSRSFDDLSQANREIENLNQKLQSENLRLSYEVEVAGKIQSMILPNEQLTDYISYDIAGFMLPATEVGGDYYDIILLPDGVRVAIGDVTDHGLESGVIMLMVQTAIATMTKFQPYPPEQVLRSTNRVLYQNILRMKSERNLSLILVDIKDDKLVITGQHEEVIILRSDDTIERISTEELGFPIGLIDEIEEFVNHLEVETAPGDVIILFTDGVTEAANHQNELYGIDRLCQTAYQCKAQSAKEICQSIMEDILSFVEGNILYDDITLVVVKK